jgi:uncharacterized membrane protein YfcA
MYTAVAAGLLCVIASSCAGSLKYLQAGLVHVPLALSLEVATTLGALLGGFVGANLPGRLLQGLFGAVLLLVALVMALDRDSVEKGGEDNDGAGDRSADGGCEGLRPRNKPLGLVASFVAGGISGILGIGGGIVKVPVMTGIMQLPVKAAIGTSAFMVGITAATSSFVYYSHNLVLPHLTGLCAMGSIGGSLLGGALGVKMPARALRAIFSIVLAGLAVQMLLKAIGGQTI